MTDQQTRTVRTSTLAPIDWPAVVIQLRQLGLSVRCIADLATIAHSQITHYSAGISSPTHAAGDRLLDVWAQSTGRAAHDAPRK